MTKKVNKHITESEDFFNRLETGDHGALDDFENEAMEGFDSLENPELAKQLHQSLNRDIEEKYFKKEKNNTFWYLSIAAGLILIIGLSILFSNFMDQEKEKLAMTDEKKEETEIKKEAETLELAAPAEEAATTAKGESKPAEKSFREPPKTSVSGLSDEKDNGVRARSVLPVAKNNQQPADQFALNDETVKDMETSVSAGPPVKTAAPAVAEEQIALQQEVSSKTTEVADKNSKRDEAPGKPYSGGELSKKEAEKISVPKEENKKGKAKEADKKNREDAPESVAKIQSENANAIPVQGNVSVADDNGYYQTRFSNSNYTKAREYIKSELAKNESLKQQVQSFKVKLTVDSQGKVVKVKFISSLKDCKNCEEALERILLDMPKWDPQTGKKTTETIEFAYP
jgi:hypothetical protein